MSVSKGQPIKIPNIIFSASIILLFKCISWSNQDEFLRMYLSEKLNAVLQFPATLSLRYPPPPSLSYFFFSSLYICQERNEVNNYVQNVLRLTAQWMCMDVCVCVEAWRGWGGVFRLVTSCLMLLKLNNNHNRRLENLSYVSLTGHLST